MNKPTVDYPIEEWERVLRINLTSQFLCCRAVAPLMVKAKYGRIVNIASIAGKEGNPNAVAYSASKAGVISLTKSLGKELAQSRRAGQLRHPGGGEDRDLRPDDRAAHRLHAVQDPDEPLRQRGRGRRRWCAGWPARIALFPPEACSTSPAAGQLIKEYKKNPATLDPVVRPPGHLRLHLSQLDQEPRRAAGPVRRPPGHRHLQHLVRAHALQHPLPRARRPRAARHPRGGRLPARVPGDVARRDADAPDRDALPQPRGDERGGVDPRQPARRGGAARRLRQDHAVDHHGRGERRPADHPGVGRADAVGQVPRHRHRLGHQRVDDVGGPARRQDQPRRVPRGRVVHAPLARALHDHGHRFHHGLDGGSARPRHAGQRRLPGGRRAPQHHRAHGGTPHRGDGEGEAYHFKNTDQESLRERDPRQCSHRRLHQRGDPSDRDRAAPRRRAHAGRLGPRRAKACTRW